MTNIHELSDYSLLKIVSLPPSMAGNENAVHPAVARFYDAVLDNRPEQFAVTLAAFDRQCDSVSKNASADNPSTFARDITTSVFAILEPDKTDPADIAAGRVAEYIDTVCFDRKITSTETNAPLPKFHDAGHYMCVAVGGAFTGLADNFHNKHSAFEFEDIKDIYVAGLLHDALHTGGSNRINKETYHFAKFEKETWKRAEKFLSAASYEGERLARMRTLIMATDPECGAPLAEMAVRYHDAKSDDGKKAIRLEANDHVALMGEQLTSKDHMKELGALRDALFKDRKTAEMAVMLTNADVALSKLTLDAYVKNTGELDAEFTETGVTMGLVKDGKINLGAAGYFFTKIACVEKASPQPTIERYHRLPGLATMNAVLDPANADRLVVKEPAGLLTAQRHDVSRTAQYSSLTH